MKKVLAVAVLAAILAVGTVSGVVFAGRFATLPPPIQGSKALAVVLSADTVTGGGSPTPSITCAQTNYFKIGQIVVFRMWANDVKNGGYPVEPANVQKGFPVVNIPNSPKPIALAMTYVQEPYNKPASQQISYWEAHWTVPAGYPLGVINFNITVKTLKTKKEPALKGVYTQKGFAPASQLQVTS